ncbi:MULTISPECIES: LytTR family DNA-binding domain-containing protein [unclassified Lactococcus]|uniref:LytR/AlgR family response regulator transcription factor n=1 Tax=unclassified Lactococcus TaxID=2643510 RepID=UPI0016505EFD|nr:MULTISPECIES: LytTR family DNA-binding domain-containing protein [unclassified Lactococcus]
MKLFKHIDSKLRETEITIAATNEVDFERYARLLANRIQVETVDGLKVIALSDLIYVEAERNYLYLHLNDDSLKVRSPLYKLKESLGADFIQVSRSYLINFKELTSVEADFVNGMVGRVGKFKIPISRAYLKNVYERMEMEK